MTKPQFHDSCPGNPSQLEVWAAPQYPALLYNRFNRCCSLQIKDFIFLRRTETLKSPFPPYRRERRLSTHFISLDQQNCQPGRESTSFCLLDTQWLVRGFMEAETQSYPDGDTVSRVTDHSKDHVGGWTGEKPTTLETLRSTQNNRICSNKAPLPAQEMIHSFFFFWHSRDSS